MTEDKHATILDAVPMFTILEMLDTWAPCPNCVGEPIIVFGHFPHTIYDGPDAIDQVDSFALRTRHRDGCDLDGSEHTEDGMFVTGDRYRDVWDTAQHAMAGVTKLLTVLTRRYCRDRVEERQEVLNDPHLYLRSSES